MFAVTPWVPKLVLVLILYLILNKYFAVLMLGGLAYWYLRKEPKKADAAASGDEAKGAGGVDAADATASALAATDKGRKSSDKKNIKSKDQKAAADKKDD